MTVEAERLLASNEFAVAVRDIERRAEREQDPRRLYDIYVDRGVLDQLMTHENQVVLGRRGVGKTHLFSYYRDYVAEKRPSDVVQLHDCRRLGSGMANMSDEPRTIAINTFAELLNDTATQAFEELDRIEDRASQDLAGDAVLAFQDVVSRSGNDGSAFDFRNLGDSLAKYVEASKAGGLVILLDEWAAIPLGAQPYVAEFLKRAFMTHGAICVKIAAVSYQTRLSEDTPSGVFGFETGADVFSDVNLDQYFVWEEDNQGAQSFFAQVLYNHLAERIGWNLDIAAEQKHQGVVELFTQEPAFGELSRAAEGNCRDLLNIFRMSFDEFRRDESARRIGIPQVQAAAETWYRQDKLRNIQDDGRKEDFLNHLIQEIIRNKKSKTFMVSYRDINHPLLARLFSARLLHPLRTTWSHPDRPGEPYHLVTMDYGCYVALKHTRAAPEEQIFFVPEETTARDDLVPLDDRRSIRRIVLPRESLDKFSE